MLLQVVLLASINVRLAAPQHSAKAAVNPISRHNDVNFIGRHKNRRSKRAKQFVLSVLAAKMTLMEPTARRQQTSAGNQVICQRKVSHATGDPY